MKHFKVAEIDFAPPAKSFDMWLMLSYVMVSVLLLFAMYAFSSHSETNLSEFVSTGVFF
jgi:hypothetical protein